LDYDLASSDEDDIVDRLVHVLLFCFLNNW
jgi:hypothetical protein